VAGKGSGGFNVGSICHDICDKRVAGTVESDRLRKEKQTEED